MQFPRTLVEFQDQFPEEEHCWAYLRRAGGRAVLFVCVAAPVSGEAGD
jgi:hypothetical protein